MTNWIHGQRCTNRTSLTYYVWLNVKDKCYNVNDPQYKHYGAVGITVCQQWENDYREFYADMGDKPDGLMLSRHDITEGFKLSNCYWATRKEINRRPCSCGRNKQYVFIAMNIQGTMIASDNQSEFARDHQMDKGGISHCLNGRRITHKGWRFEWMT